VTIAGENSVVFNFLLGIVHGLILGPVLYAIFVSPMFKIADYFAIRNKVLPLLIIDIEKSLEAITKWLKQSGMVS
jgi:hypothetical protein